LQLRMPDEIMGEIVRQEALGATAAPQIAQRIEDFP
jgi:hypothetical protein